MTEGQKDPIESRSESKPERAEKHAENKMQGEAGSKQDRESWNQRQQIENKDNEARRQLSPAELAVKASRDKIPVSQLVSKTSEVFGRVAIGDDSGKDLVAGITKRDIDSLRQNWSSSQNPENQEHVLRKGRVEAQVWLGDGVNGQPHGDRIIRPINLGAD